MAVVSLTDTERVWSAIGRYRRYLNAVDREAEKSLSEENYLDLLSDGEIIDLLCTRDELAQLTLNASEQTELEELDDLLEKHHRVISENLPPLPAKPRSRWWWHVNELTQPGENLAKSPAVGSATLRRIRRLHLLSTRDLARIAGVSPKTISQIEAGKVRRPNNRVIQSISRSLGVSPSETYEFRPFTSPSFTQRKRVSKHSSVA
jgi:DNA-binding XRE family transcriptional regulator